MRSDVDNQDQIPTQLVRELPNKRRLNDSITSVALIAILTADVCLRLVEIILRGLP